MGDDITVVSIQIFEIFTKHPMSKSRTDLESQYINETEISSYWPYLVVIEMYKEEEILNIGTANVSGPRKC